MRAPWLVTRGQRQAAPNLAVTLLWLPAAAWAVSAANLYHCVNLGNGPINCIWHNGNLNANQAHWLEGDSAPYQLVLSGLDDSERYSRRAFVHEGAEAAMRAMRAGGMIGGAIRSLQEKMKKRLSIFMRLSPAR